MFYVCLGSEIVILWSKMWGGKRHYHTIRALEWFFDEFKVGAETLYLCHDYQFINQFHLRYLSWLCHPDNPCRRFKQILFSAYVFYMFHYLSYILFYLCHISFISLLNLKTQQFRCWSFL